MSHTWERCSLILEIWQCKKPTHDEKSLFAWPRVSSCLIASRIHHNSKGVFSIVQTHDNNYFYEIVTQHLSKHVMRIVVGQSGICDTHLFVILRLTCVSIPRLTQFVCFSSHCLTHRHAPMHRHYGQQQNHMLVCGWLGIVTILCCRFSIFRFARAHHQPRYWPSLHMDTANL